MSQKTKYPLRKVLGHTMVPLEGTKYEFLHEVLECGHTQRPNSDCYGEYHAARRRCRQCYKLTPPADMGVTVPTAGSGETTGETI